MTQLALDLATALEARDRGIARARHANSAFMARALPVAKELARRGPITADMVRAECEARGIRPLSSTNAWGALFRLRCWEWTGEMRRSANVLGRGRLQHVWRLRGC